MQNFVVIWSVLRLEWWQFSSNLEFSQYVFSHEWDGCIDVLVYKLKKKIFEDFFLVVLKSVDIIWQHFMKILIVFLHFFFLYSIPLVLNLDYFMRIRSIPLLLILWLLVFPGYQHHGIDDDAPSWPDPHVSTNGGSCFVSSGGMSAGQWCSGFHTDTLSF